MDLFDMRREFKNKLPGLMFFIVGVGGIIACFVGFLWLLVAIAEDEKARAKALAKDDHFITTEVEYYGRIREFSTSHAWCVVLEKSGDDVAMSCVPKTRP